MAEDTSELNKDQGRGLSRRSFLKLVGLGGAGVVLSQTEIGRTITSFIG